MEYLQYEIRSMKTVSNHAVLNLVISGIPSILYYDLVKLEDEKAKF